jgi:hypothetical protein
MLPAGTNDSNLIVEGFMINGNQLNFTNCMLKVKLNTSLNNNLLYNFTDTSQYQNVFLNENAAFVNSRLNNYTIPENSFAIAKGNVAGY